MNKYNIFCDNCTYKKIIKESNDLKTFKIINSSPIQKALPKLDPITKKLQKSTDLELPKKVKCPKCGFAIRPKIIREAKDEQ